MIEQIPVKIDDIAEDKNASILKTDSVFIESVEGHPAGTVWRVRAINAGLSVNGIFYPDSTLREAVSLFDGARVFEKADEEHLNGKGKATKNLIGQLRNAQFVEGHSPNTGEIDADLHLLETSGLPAKLLEMWNRGMSSMVGFSIDAKGAAAQKGTFREARSITKVRSLDLIVEPGAGGRIINLIEAVGAADMALRERMVEALKTAHGGQIPSGVDIDDDDSLETAYREAVKSPSNTVLQTGGAGGTSPNPPLVKRGEYEQLKERLDLQDMREAVASSGLPDPVRDKFGRWIERGTTLQNLREAIADEKDTLAKLTQAGHVTGLGAGRLEAGQSRSEKIATMLDDFFDTDKKAVSFRECYVEITGDKGVSGLWRNCDKVSLREAAGADFREAVDTSTFALTLGDSITRRLIRLYNLADVWSDWQWLCDVVPLSDFRVQDRTRIGGYGDLPIVGQGDPYIDQSTPGETQQQYAAQKRGGTEQINLEAIMNDDVGALRRIPQMLATSAKRTLYKFVYSFLLSNVTMGDGKALFHTDRGNLGSAALDATSFYAARLAMSKTAELSSGERLGILLQHLAGPFELEGQAYNLFVRGTNFDLTFVQQLKLNWHSVTHWTDANDWIATADKSSMPLIELGFIGGNQEPELFVQDLPTQGSLFSNDQITYKIRHMYGGTVLSPDGFYKSVVA